MAELRILAVPGLPEIGDGANLGQLIADACSSAGIRPEPGDVFAVSSKIVSKAAGLWAADRESAVHSSTRRVVAERATGDHVTRVVESTAGPVMAAGGVDASNTGGRDDVLVLPDDPDASARQLRDELGAALGLSERLGVVVTDTAGRPWRAGQVDFALGAAGLQVLDDLRGSVDADGRELGVTARAIADEVAAAADLVKGKQEHVPVAIVRGLARWVGGEIADGATQLIRTGPGDWFALGHVEAVRAALGVGAGSLESERVGIRAVHEESRADRVARAVRLAAAGESVEVTLGEDAAQVAVKAATAYAAGRFAARLEAALWAEEIAPASVQIVDA